MSEEGNEGVRIVRDKGLIRSFKRKDGIVVIDTISLEKERRRDNIEKHGAL